MDDALITPQQTRDVHPMLVQCWANVNIEPILYEHFVFAGMACSLSTQAS